ncbi:hypothetical protein BUALT_Bualt03G0143900 [Buddleja alternifolia]|uniref:DDE Tnp4 domain-containing protein n=1 Tax=Buddleja alternifolia TaxID=168488 RepID=A0AAV6XY11_9LAMI|nr:hypothetical protein BUALT_Bualt03G0143900 [Buddleja alternifolia]
MAHRMPDQISRVFRLTGNNDADCLSQLRMDMSTFALLKLHPLILVIPKPIDDECTNARWKSFKGCLGSLDEMYIDIQTPLHDKPRYRNRKGGISVNVLGVVNREMNFVYMLLGWEGSAADGRVLRDAVNRVNGLKVSNC